MKKILTFNELKEIAKKIAMDDDRVEKLYIEQLETQSMSSDVNFFNILYLVKDLSFDDTALEFIQCFGDVLTMFENTENEKVIEYNLTEDEMKRFTACCEAIRENIAKGKAILGE